MTDDQELSDYDRGYRDGQAEVIVTLFDALRAGRSLEQWLEDLHAADIRRRLDAD